MERIALWIPGLPQNKVGPNTRRKRWQTVKEMTLTVKRDFSYLLEEIYPRISRPIYPLTQVIYHITFAVQTNDVVDYVNLFGRMKPWEDVLVDEQILLDDSMAIVREITLSHRRVQKQHMRGTEWVIQEIPE